MLHEHQGTVVTVRVFLCMIAAIIPAIVATWIISINDRPATAAVDYSRTNPSVVWGPKIQPDLESLPQRIDALIQSYEKEQQRNAEAHEKTTKELSSVIINLMILLKTNEVEIDRVAFKTNWNLNLIWGATNTNRMVVRYME